MDLMRFGQENNFCCTIGEYLQIYSVTGGYPVT